MKDRLRNFRDLTFGVAWFIIARLLILVQWFVILVLGTLIGPIGYLLNTAATLLFFCSLGHFLLHGRHPIEMGYYMLGVSFVLALLPVFLDRLLDWIANLGSPRELRI